jgi:hypothetical protein
VREVGNDEAKAYTWSRLQWFGALGTIAAAGALLGRGSVHALRRDRGQGGSRERQEQVRERGEAWRPHQREEEAGHAARRWGHSAHMAATPWAHVTRWGIPLNSWRVSEWASWNMFLGWL